MTENSPKSWRERAAEAAAAKADDSPLVPPEPAPVEVPTFDAAAEFDEDLDDDTDDEDDTDF